MERKAECHPDKPLHIKKQCKSCYYKNRYRMYRLKVLELYGGKCACCGELNVEFLAIDHIHGGGRQARIGKSGSMSYFIEKLRTYQPEKYRILCHNCNMSFGFFGYCPHQKEALKSI